LGVYDQSYVLTSQCYSKHFQLLSKWEVKCFRAWRTWPYIRPNSEEQPNNSSSSPHGEGCI